MPVTAETVWNWPEARVRREYATRLERVRAIRDGAGGTLTAVVGEDAHEVRRVMAELDVLGQRLDAVAVEAEQSVPPRPPASTGRTTFPLDGGTGPAAPALPAGSRSTWTANLAQRYPDLLGGLSASVGTLEMPSLLVEPRVVELGRRNLLAAIPVRQIDGPSFAYLRQSVRTNLAAPVATGALKPTSVATVEMVTDTVRTVATLSERVPREYVADFAALREWLEQDLRWMVLEAIETQVISGSGTPPAMDGIRNVSGIQVHAKGADPIADALHKAITLCRINAAREPSHIALNPADFERLALAKATTGEYLFTEPGAGDLAPTIWGVPIVVTTGLPVGIGLVGDFAGSARLYEREGVRLDWSEAGFDPAAEAGEGAGDFERNYLRFRAEARVGLAVLRPVAFVEVTGLNA
jgi:hypothetical protein